MKKFLIVLLACLAFLLFQACFCNDLMRFITGVSPLASDFTGQWHSKVACEENEDEPYRWGVDLKEDDSGAVTGTIYFHDCPGGGAVTYSVKGQHEDGVTPLVLLGTRIDGRYILYMNSPETQVFEIMKGAAPQPNFTD